MATLTQRQRLEKAAVRLMSAPEFIAYSAVMMVGDTTVEPDPKKCPTAYTDGFNCVYGEKFCETLNDEQLKGLMLHETMHKMYRHTMLWQHLFKQAPALANIAADFVVNDIIQEAIDAGATYVSLPPGAIHDVKYRNWSVGEIFRDLCKKYPEAANPQAVVCAGFPDGSLDEHGWGDAESWSAEEQQQIQQQIDAAIRQGNILAGKVAGQQARDIGELMEVPIDPWALLRQFLRDTCQGEGELSYQRPSRRFLPYDMIMPTEICNTLPHIIFGIDTSGSIHGEALTYLLSNVAHVFKTVDPERVDLLYWDTQVAGVETYERGELDKMLASTQPAGGGGTSPQCVSNYLRDEKLEPTVLVMLTDGYVDAWPTDPGVPVIWLMYENKSANPPYGVVAHI